MKGKCLTGERVNCLILIVNQKPFMSCCLSRIHVSVNGLMKLIHLSIEWSVNKRKKQKEGGRKEKGSKVVRKAERGKKERYFYRKIMNSY